MSAVSSVSIPNQFHNVFVYGSLLADDVVQVLLKRVPPSAPATLPDHHRFSIKGRVYPAILPVEDKKVTGRVLQGISDLELFILDEFEDIEYERSDVHVYLKDNSEKLQAHTYIWSNKSDPNVYGDWDFEDWKRTYMNDFIKMTEEFIKELDLPESKRRIQTYESVFKQDNDKPPEP
ncbi:AIG2-like protein D [Neltuma alba]|uniref:AIG2-like protein D n=1 Tax=Neltuma alba TaxID=207710 RepID=UPI0010A3D3A6|nr:AIG2-like protein D [Prosopis alba]XP_028781311.1 AIG2-like protein D [Prosopis alba]